MELSEKLAVRKAKQLRNEKIILIIKLIFAWYAVILYCLRLAADLIVASHMTGTNDEIMTHLFLESEVWFLSLLLLLAGYIIRSSHLALDKLTN